MIKFILVSEHETRKYQHLIDTVLLKKYFSYKYYKFNNDNKNLEEYIGMGNQNNIFIIEDTNNINSLNIIDKIRYKYNNILSFIIVINFNDKKKKSQIKTKSLYNTVVFNSDDHYEEKFRKVIEQVVKSLTTREKTLSVLSRGIIYKIPFSDILYIEKEANTKLSIIHCKKDTIDVNKTLNDLILKLDNNFLQTHRSAVINKANVKTIDFVANKIYFNTGAECNLLSRSYKKITKEEFSKQVEKITK